MTTLCIRNGRVLDPSRDLDAVCDLWIVDGKVAEATASADIEIDASGKLVMPGLVDVHVHLREPGREEAETVATGCAAAVAGGFTSIACMPNTTPAMDCPDVVRQVLAKAAAANGPRVYAVPCVTVDRGGETLADLKALVMDGVVGFTDDGAGVEDDALCRRAFEVCAELGMPLAQHCEIGSVAAGGVTDPSVAEGVGLPGYPAKAETLMIERDLKLAEETGAHVHFQHLSAAKSVDLVRAAKARGVKVTAEVTPHHLALTCDDAVLGGTNFKMNPPLRTAADREALLNGVRDGALDCIATDHAPHTTATKLASFVDAPNGIIGMETAVGVVWTRLVLQDVLSPLDMARRMSTGPAEAMGLLQKGMAGTLAPGSAGDVTIIDPEAEWVVDARAFHSKSRNCPFTGWTLRGRVTTTIVNGEVRFDARVC